MIWPALIGPVLSVFTNKPWQATPSQDAAPVVDRPDYTGVIVVAIVGIALIILMIVILRKK